MKLAGPDGTILSKMDDAPDAQGIRPVPRAAASSRRTSSSNWATQNAIKVTTKNAVPMNAWSHVFVTYDGSSKAAGVRVYIDGRPQEVTTEVGQAHRFDHSASRRW